MFFNHLLHTDGHKEGNTDSGNDGNLKENVNSALAPFDIDIVTQDDTICE